MQLPLNIRLSEVNRFSNFDPGQNEELVALLKDSITALSAESRSHVETIFIWGSAGSGKTHLLQAACQLARDLEMESVYLPLGEAGVDQPEILDDLYSLPLVCVDNVQLIAGQASWEAALFRLYEGIRDRGTLLIASEHAPAESGFNLPDLVSRFQRGLVYGLRSLNHEQRMWVLRQRARLRGLEISDEAAAYIEKHFSRDMLSLVRLLEQLDHESLVQQRKITVPFIKSFLED
jgi:DnaA family protein